MAQCSAITANGTRCTLQANSSNGLCWSHDPRTASQRQKRARRAGRRGGRGKIFAEIREVKAQIQEMVDNTLSGQIPTGKASVCGQLLNIKLRAIELERRVKETEELEDRLLELEKALESCGISA